MNFLKLIYPFMCASLLAVTHPASATLSDLSEVPLRKILAHLGSEDRAAVRTTCKYLHHSGWAVDGGRTAVTIRPTRLTKQENQITFTPQGQRAIHSLRAFNLESQGDGDETASIATLVQALKTFPHLDTVFLDRSKLSSADTQTVVRILRGLRNVHGLNLVESTVDTRHLCQGLPHMTGLTELVLSDNDLGPEGATQLTPALQQMRRLRRLNLSDNHLGPEGATHLAPALQQMTQLTALNLAGNDFDTEGAANLAPALQQMTQLTALNLSWNDFDPESARHLAPALQQMTQLTALSLAGNDFGPEGAAHLAPALQQMTELRELDLSTNLFGPEGARHLTPALQQMTGLRELVLQNNQFGPEDEQMIRDAVAQLPQRVALNLY